MNSRYFRHFARLIGTGSLLMAFAIPAYSDELYIKSVGDEPANSAEGIPRPSTGLSMEQVLQQFGEPQQKLGAVGDPPISRWVYEKFIIYFEHKTVIHSVVPK